MMLHSPVKSTGKRQALPKTVEMAKVNNHLKLRVRLSRAKIKAKNAALGSMDKVGGVGMSDLDLAGWGVPFVFLYYSMLICSLIFFSVTGTLTIIKSKYLALIAPSDAVCHEVPQAITATFSGDFNGKWETKAGFNYNSSLYKIEFKGVAINNNQYSDAMVRFQARLNYLGQKASSRPGIWSAMAYSTFSFTDKATNLRFYSNVDAGIVNDQELYATAYSSRYGVCNYTAGAKVIYGTYDTIVKSFVLHVPLNVSLANVLTPNYTTNNVPVEEPCPQQGYIRQTTAYQGLPVYYAGEYTLAYDVRTISIVVALNIGILLTSDLVETVSVFTFSSGLGAVGSFYIDPFYVPMDPVFCIDKRNAIFNLSNSAINGPEICFLVNADGGALNPLVIYPAMNQQRSTGDGWIYEPCICPRDALNLQCNVQDYYYTLIQNSGHSNSSGNLYSSLGASGSIVDLGIRMQKFVVDDSVNGDKAMETFFAKVTTYSILQNAGYGYLPSQTGLDTSQPNVPLAALLTQQWDIICPTFDCSGVVFESYGGFENSLFLSVNPFIVQFGQLTNNTYLKGNQTFPRQMCIDSLSQVEAMESFSISPPVGLIQDYLECRTKLESAIVASIGSAAGSALLYSGVVITTIGLIVVTLHNIQHRSKAASKLLNREDKARREERATMLEKEAMTLLLEGLVKSVERIEERHGGDEDIAIFEDTLGEALDAFKILSTSRNRIEKIDVIPAPIKIDPPESRVLSHGSSIRDLLAEHDQLLDSLTLEKTDLRTKGMLSSI